MASFTDTPTQFNPYVQQLPVEAMVKVGMYKQEKYEEGITKIQGYIDNIAGLDIYKDVHKEYLQSKLNELGNNISKVAGGDFSNFQLVNSVTGMASQIIKDPVIQNAVSSTAKIKKEQETVEADKKAGKLDPSNQLKWTKQLSSWSNDGDLTSPFSGAYTPFFDVFKFAKESFDAVLPDQMTWDEVFSMGQDGKPLTDKKGNLIYSPAMTRMEKEGRFPEKVRATLEQIFSDPKVAQQLSITGEYDYRNYDGNALFKKVTTQKDEIVAGLNERLLDLQLKKNNGKDVQKEIDAITAKSKTISDSYNQYAQLAMTNPDSVRGQLYKDDVTNRYTTMFGQIKTKQTVMENPYWNQNFKLQQETNRVREAEDTKRLGYLNYQLNVEKNAWDKSMDLLKYKLEVTKITNKAQEDLPGGPKQGPQKSEFDIVQSYDDEYTNTANTYANSVNNLLFSTLLNTDANSQRISDMMKGGKTKEEAMNILVNNGAKANGEEPNTFRARWLDKVIKDKNALSSAELEKRPDLKNIYGNYIEIKQKFNFLSNTKKKGLLAPRKTASPSHPRNWMDPKMVSGMA